MIIESVAEKRSDGRVRRRYSSQEERRTQIGPGGETRIPVKKDGGDEVRKGDTRITLARTGGGRFRRRYSSIREKGRGRRGLGGDTRGWKEASASKTKSRSSRVVGSSELGV